MTQTGDPTNTDKSGEYLRWNFPIRICHRIFTWRWRNCIDDLKRTHYRRISIRNHPFWIVQDNFSSQFFM